MKASTMAEHSFSTGDKNLKTKEEVTRQSISNISEAISTVVSHSTNDEFRKTCFSFLEVPNSSSLAAAVSSKLTSISYRHHGVSVPSQTTTQEKPPVAPCDQKNSQQLATIPSLKEDQEISEVQPTDPMDDFDLDFNDEDFFADFKETVISDTLHQTPPHESNVATLPSIQSPNSLEVLSSSFTKEDWFNEVLDTDLFFNES